MLKSQSMESSAMVASSAIIQPQTQEKLYFLIVENLDN